MNSCCGSCSELLSVNKKTHRICEVQYNVRFCCTGANESQKHLRQHWSVVSDSDEEMDERT